MRWKNDLSRSVIHKRFVILSRDPPLHWFRWEYVVSEWCEFLLSGYCHVKRLSFAPCCGFVSPETVISSVLLWETLCRIFLKKQGTNKEKEADVIVLQTSKDELTISNCRYISLTVKFNIASCYQVSGGLIRIDIGI